MQRFEDVTFILPRHFPAALIIFAEDWTFFPVWFDDYFEQVCTFVVLIALVLKVLRKGAKRTTAAVTEAFTVKENLKIVSLSVEINCKMAIKYKTKKNMHADHRFGWLSVTVSVMLFVIYENCWTFVTYVLSCNQSTPL